ncbi:MAG: ketosteroid isomerase-like protein [Ilumatobacter sp.]|jgi:ketosteroid isomerase-like protein
MSPHELQRLLDEREIVAVAVTYCFALDTHDWDALRQVFTPDATANLGVPAQQVGIDAIIERISGALSGLDNSQHLVGNHEVVVTGDTATHRCYLQAQHIRAVPNGSPLFMIAGRYEDEFVRTPDGWRIGHRTLTTMWREGNSAVVQF